MNTYRGQIMKGNQVIFNDVEVIIEEATGLKKVWGGAFLSTSREKLGNNEYPLTLMLSDGRKGEFYIARVTNSNGVNTVYFRGTGSLR